MALDMCLKAVVLLQKEFGTNETLTGGTFRNCTHLWTIRLGKI